MSYHSSRATSYVEVFGESQTPFVYLVKSELNLEGSIFINAPLAMPVELFNATLLDTEFTWLEVRFACVSVRFERRASNSSRVKCPTCKQSTRVRV